MSYPCWCDLDYTLGVLPMVTVWSVAASWRFQLYWLWRGTTAWSSTRVLDLLLCVTLPHLRSLRWGSYNSIKMSSGGFLGFNVLTCGWVKMIADHASLFRLTSAVPIIITDLLFSSSAVLLTQALLICCASNEVKAIVLACSVCSVGSYTALLTIVCTTLSRRQFCHER